MQAIILPGNGNTPITANWYPEIKEAMEENGVKVIAEDMPDAELARREYWVPFIEEKLQGDEEAILIGHSSGTVAILRYLEKNKAKLAFLVAAYHTDLNLEAEKLSGYFDDPWDWEAIKSNCENIVLMNSEDDEYISIEEPRFIKEQLECDLIEMKQAGHFNGNYQYDLMVLLLHEVRELFDIS